MATEKVRQVKLHSKYRRGSAKFFEAVSKPVPWLNVSGILLERAGFRIECGLHSLGQDHLPAIFDEWGAPAKRDLALCAAGRVGQ